MKKSVLTREYAVLLKTWRDARRKAGVTQFELAKKLGQTQSFVSKCERGAARLDVVQLRTFCRATQTTLPKLIKGKSLIETSGGKNLARDPVVNDVPANNKSFGNFIE